MIKFSGARNKKIGLVILDLDTTRPQKLIISLLKPCGFQAWSVDCQLFITKLDEIVSLPILPDGLWKHLLPECQGLGTLCPE